MADVLEPARSARARCRGCATGIAKGELRFGEAIDNPYGEGEVLRWFHVACAAERRPERFAAALAACDAEVPDRDALQAIADAGIRNPNLSRVRGAERAPTGRARCRECRELIEKGALRVILDVEADVAAMATRYYVHAGCAVAHVGRDGLRDRLRRATPDLPPDDRAELDRWIESA